MHDLLVGLRLDVEMLKTVLGNAVRVGPIAQVDPVKGYRIKLGDTEDGPALSPWYPHPESGGQTSSWQPLSVGQIVGVMHANGDQRQGVLLRAGFSGDEPPPSDDLQRNVLKAFGITVTMKDGKIIIEGDLEVRGNTELKGNVDARSGHLRHDDTNVGKDHVHREVTPGPADTGYPH